MANNLTFTDGNMTLKNITEYPNSFKRQGAFPLERFSVFNTKAALEDYAKSNPVAYVGQILALVTESNGTTEVTVYSIQDSKGTLAEVGKATAGDEASISLDSDSGILSLKNWGKEYYKEVSGEDGTTSYQKVTVDKDNPWIEGLVPRVASTDTGFELRWYVPSTKEIEGLSESITTINGRLDGIDTKFNDYVTKAGTETISGAKTFSKPVVVATPTADTHATTKKYVDDKVSGLGSVFNLKAVTDDITKVDISEMKAGDVVLVKIADATGNDIEIEYVVVDDGDTKRFEKIGDPTGVSGAVSRINTLENTVNNSHATSIAKHEKSLYGEDGTSGLTKNVSDIETAIGTDATANSIKGRIKTVEDSIGTDATANSIKGRIKTVEGNVSDIETAIGTDVAANTIKGRIKTVEGKVSDIEDKLGDSFETGAQVNKIENIKVTTATGTVSVDSETKTAIIDITKVTDSASADVAKATTGILTAFGKTFNGSKDVEIKSTDVVDIATTAKAGIVKANSADIGGVVVADDGTMSVAKVASATTADTASKVAHALKFGTKSFDGSAETTITLTDLGFDSSAYATKEQGAKADSAVQSIAIGETAFTVTSGAASITAASARTAMGLGTAALKADSYFATATALSTLDGSAVKTSGDQTIDGTKTFSKPVVVATPTADTHATTKKYVDDELAKKLAAGDAMTFKGLLGTDGTVTSLPTTNVNNGDTYKVITSGTYGSTNAKVGDMFIAVVSKSGETVSIDWTLVPSGDDGNVYSDATLTADQLVVGNDGQKLKALAAGTNGQILKMVSGKPAWAAESFTTVTSEDESIDVVKSGNNYDLSVKDVNCNALSQTDGDYLILDGGSSTVNI